ETELQQLSIETIERPRVSQDHVLDRVPVPEELQLIGRRHFCPAPQLSSLGQNAKSSPTVYLAGNHDMTVKPAQLAERGGLSHSVRWLRTRCATRSVGRRGSRLLWPRTFCWQYAYSASY